MAVVIAVDKFRGSLTSTEAVEAISRGLRAVCPHLQIRSLPLADGGEGTVEAAVAVGFSPATVTVYGPLGATVSATIAVRGDTALVELAETVGIVRLEGQPLDPMRASTYGLGQGIRRALDLGVKRVIVGLGGSASTDGGAGMLQALGARFEDERGRPIPPGGDGLRWLARMDLSGLDSRIAATEFIVACDVDNPLFGSEGAAAVYARQKGASDPQIELLDAALRRFADVCVTHTTQDYRAVPGAGAAGGTGFACLAFLSGKLVSGVDLMLDLVDLDDALTGVDLVITGEGCLDAQSLRGKAPVGVARRSRRAGVEVVAAVGTSTLTIEESRHAGFARVYELSALRADLDECMRSAGTLLERVASTIIHETPRLGGRSQEGSQCQ